MKIALLIGNMVLIGVTIVVMVGCESTPQPLKAEAPSPGTSPVVQEPERTAAQQQAVAKAETPAAPTPVTATAEPAPAKPVAKKPAVKKPVAKQPAAEKPAVKKPAAKKPTPVPRRDDAGMLRLDRLKHDFGTVEPQSRNTATFVLTNSGQQALELNQPKGSCSCTVPTLKKKTLEPGESVEMPVTYKAKSNPGKTTTRVTVTTKAPAKPAQQVIELASEVIRYITATPNRLVFQVREDAETPKVVLSSDLDEAFKITGFSCAGQVAKVIFDKELAQVRHELALEVNLENLRKINRGGSLTIRTDHPKLKSMNIYFTAEKAFVSHPGSRSIAKLRPGETRSSFVTIVSSFGEEFELGEITSKKGNIKVTDTEKTQDGYKVKFDFFVPEDQKRGYVVDHLEVPIKGRDNDVVSVRCYAQVRPEVTSQSSRSVPASARVRNPGP